MSSPVTSYTILTDTFTLGTPTREGYTFVGWTGSNGTEPQETITIQKGSTGNKKYTANWISSLFAVYSETDTSLRFYNDVNGTPTIGETYNNLVVTKVYDNLGSTSFISESSVPWTVDYGDTITEVVVEDIIRPTSTAYWFSGLVNASNFDLQNLDTSTTTTFEKMFYNTGYNVTTQFVIIGLDDLITENVTSFNSMFEDAGYNATIVFLGDLSGWNTENVRTTSHMFDSTGYNAMVIEVGDLSGWNMSNNQDMSYMFACFGSNINLRQTVPLTSSEDLYTSSYVWRIGNIGSWNMKACKTTEAMFAYAGQNAGYALLENLDSWDVSNIQNMNSMFYHAFDFPLITFDLSGWDVSSVTSYENFIDTSDTSQTNRFTLPSAWEN